MKKLFFNIYIFFFSYPVWENRIVTWNYGFFAFIFLLVQIISGLFLSMYCRMCLPLPLDCVEMFIIMPHVILPWFLGCIHFNVTPLFFACVYIHVVRKLYYFSDIKFRIIAYNIGVIVLIFMIIMAITKFDISWFRMSSRFVSVITNFFGTTPIFREFIFLWFCDYSSISAIILNRFFIFHFIFPFLLLFFTFLHFTFLHKIDSSSNTLIVEKKDKTVFFRSFYSYKDLIFILIVFFVFIWFFRIYLADFIDSVLPEALFIPDVFDSDEEFDADDWDLLYWQQIWNQGGGDIEGRERIFEFIALAIIFVTVDILIYLDYI